MDSGNLEILSRIRSAICHYRDGFREGNPSISLNERGRSAPAHEGAGGAMRFGVRNLRVESIAKSGEV